MVRVEGQKVETVPCNCTIDDDDDDDVTPPKPAPVQYVRMSEWQEPESAKRVAAEVQPHVDDGTPRYTEFPKLTKHAPIGDTKVWGRYRYWR